MQGRDRVSVLKHTGGVVPGLFLALLESTRHVHQQWQIHVIGACAANRLQTSLHGLTQLAELIPERKNNDITSDTGKSDHLKINDKEEHWLYPDKK